jgi:flagellar basal-body rod protein FlgB
VDAISSVIINKALDGLQLRAEATAQNIASASSRDFRPMQVEFEQSLRAAAARGSDAVRDLSLTITRAAPGPMGDEPRLDLELATASETSLRYGALLDMLGRQMQIARSVIRGGQ